MHAGFQNRVALWGGMHLPFIWRYPAETSSSPRISAFAHDPEDRNDLRKGSCAKSKCYSVLCASNRTRGAVEAVMPIPGDYCAPRPCFAGNDLLHAASRFVPAPTTGGRGGIGRRAALRSLWGNPWKFESSRPHQHPIHRDRNRLNPNKIRLRRPAACGSRRALLGPDGGCIAISAAHLPGNGFLPCWDASPSSSPANSAQSGYAIACALHAAASAENELVQKSFFPESPNFETLFLWNL